MNENHPFINKFAPYNNPPTIITLSLSKVILIFLYHIPMLCTLFAIPVTALLRSEDIAYTLTQKSVFHFLTMYTSLQIRFYPHKEQIPIGGLSPSFINSHS